jgi:hypothetical protein
VVPLLESNAEDSREVERVATGLYL